MTNTVIVLKIKISNIAKDVKTNYFILKIIKMCKL
jgi:hypothetical protein